MKLRDMPTYQTKYLRPADLQGRSVAVTISNVTMEEFFNRQKKAKQKSAVLWFAGKQKGLIVNMTRLIQLEEMFGTDDTDTFIGKKILIHPTKQNGKDTIFISGLPEQE